MRVRQFLLTLVIIGVTIVVSSATIVTGKVSDASGQPLPFVGVYIKGTSHGTTTNTDGIYSIDLQPGTYSVIFRLLGYKSQEKSITVSAEKITLNIALQEETLQMQEVSVSANSEDPAYAMIRHAIKMRKHYLEQVDAYSCDVYIKGLERITKYPKKLLGHNLSDDDFNRIDTTGIVYLSESVSKFNYEKPDRVHEEMISSKVSGDNKAFSYNQASDMLFNFYENIMEVQNLSERGFISPVSNNALFSYNYKLIGTYQENGVTVDKIEVIPKRKNDPVFRGYIYLEESGWRIYSTDLYLTKDAQIDFVDTLVIQQNFVPVNNDVWMPFNNKFLFHASVFGIKYSGVYVGVDANYNVNPNFTKHFFGGEELKINDDANKKDTAYWHETRPVPLTAEEVNDYRRRDSIMAIRNSKKYLDSVDKKNNKFNPLAFVLGGYSYRDRYTKETFSISSLITDLNFNTVQGLVTGLNFYYNKEMEKNRSFNISPDIFYGFSNHRLNGRLSAYYNYKPEKFRSLSISGGVITQQFNSSQPIIPIINTLYTLLAKENYMKVYQLAYLSAYHNMELVNGINFGAGLNYEDRSSLLNTTNFTIVKKSYEYTSNDPQQVVPEGQPSFTENKALIFRANLNFVFKQRYYTRPHEKILLDNKYPVLNIGYKKGISNVLGSSVNYDYLSATLTGKFNLKLLGHSKWTITAGKFINNASMYFMDYHHFNGDQTFLSVVSQNSFDLLPYYKYSTNDQFIEARFEHNFGGLILNKFPLIRKLHLSEIAGINYLSANTISQYIELYAGIEKFRIFRLSFVTGFSEGQRVSTGFRLGINIFGN